MFLNSVNFIIETRITLVYNLFILDTTTMKSNNKPHLLSIDLESWIFSKKINQRKLSVKQLRKLDNGYTLNALDHTLKLLKKHRQKITFFVVTKLDELYPGLIESIAKDGHEIAWHTHSHRIITNTKILEKELEAAKKIIRKYKIKGFQAPSIYFIKEGYPLLKRYGFKYSSSIYGNSNRIYCFDGIYEIPVSTLKESYNPSQEEIILPNAMSLKGIIKHGLPYGSSYFWGLLGKKFYLKKLREAQKEKNILNMFLHEWQILKPPPSKYYSQDVGIFNNPLFFPYRIEIQEMLESMLSKFSFQRYIDHVENESK